MNLPLPTVTDPFQPILEDGEPERTSSSNSHHASHLNLAGRNLPRPHELSGMSLWLIREHRVMFPFGFGPKKNTQSSPSSLHEMS